MRFVHFLFLSPFLAGCSIPGAVGLAGLALEGGSVVATGKSATDQIVSAAVEKDCELLEGLTRGKPCKEKGLKKEEKPPPGRKLTAQAASRTNARAGRRWIPRTQIDDRWTFLVGTYEELGEADKRARLVGPIGASISSTVVDGKVHYRVTAGLFPFQDADRQREKVGGPGVDKMAVLRVCPSWMQDETCISLDRIIRQATPGQRKAKLKASAGS